MSEIDDSKVWQCPWHFFAFGFGLGLLPKAPGTFGTLLGFVFYFIFIALPWQMYIILTVLAFVFGCYICDVVSKELGLHDYGGIVWDEVVGLLVTLTFVKPKMLYLVLGFILFRLFDILKPWPICLIDKHIQGGTGIMLDDVVAAIPAWAILQVIILLLA